MVQINFRAGENTGGGWEPLPEGTCIFEIQSVEVGVSGLTSARRNANSSFLFGKR